MMYNQMEGGKSRLKKILRTNLFVFLPLLIIAVIVMVPQGINAAETEAAGMLSSASGLGFISAALATGLATLGAGYAVAVVGSAALGAVSEDSSLLGKTLIFVGLAEGIAIYGLIVSIMILGRL
jgi:V/A-type H+-transporting ATPase subunit K